MCRRLADIFRVVYKRLISFLLAGLVDWRTSIRHQITRGTEELDASIRERFT